MPSFGLLRFSTWLAAYTVIQLATAQGEHTLSSPITSSSAGPSQTAEETRTQTFLSRPKQTSLRLDVIKAVSNASTSDAGYIFISPYFTTFTPTGVSRPWPKKRKWGPHIFDQEGNLIWHAPDAWVEQRAWPFQACDYAGELGNHICINDGNIDLHGGYSNGITRIFNSSYVEVARFTATADLPGPDGHELNVVDQGRRLLHDAYQPMRLDLTGFSQSNNGSFFAGCFQERDTASGEAVFTWCSSDHVPMDESWIGSRPTHAVKVHPVERPWDYLHINGVDKDVHGDYYISGKTTNTIYKIAGPQSNLGYPGSIIWKFAGWKRGANSNDFEMLAGLNFSGQHHPRILSVQDDRTVISLFDNAVVDRRTTYTSTSSNGKIIELNTTAMTARLLEQYLPPNNHSCAIQGTTQRLPNGNVFMGWGPNNILTEHAPGLPGKVLWYSTFGSGLDLENYRAYKHPWTGFPLDPPDVFAYAQSCDSPIFTYMSWNGATKYRKWAVYAADSATGEGRALTTVNRGGFETKAELPSSGMPSYIYVEALDESGEVLGTSKRVKVWVPDESVAEKYHCTFDRCTANKFSYEEEYSQHGECN